MLIEAGVWIYLPPMDYWNLQTNLLCVSKYAAFFRLYQSRGYGYPSDN